MPERPPADASDVDCLLDSTGDGGRLRILGEAILAVTRELSRQMPPPRGQPYFGLEYLDGDPSPLNQFCRRGIFRKYESVLDLGAGLGAEVRWWSAHFGCRVVGMEPCVARAAVAATLSRRARSSHATAFAAGRCEALPFRPRSFTHVWCAERIRDPHEGDERLREAFRVVRPGGHVALQGSGVGEGWARDAAGALRSVGFAEIECESTVRAPIAESTRGARERLLRFLAEGDSEARALGGRLGELYARRAEARRCVLHVFARRPPA